MKRSRRRTAGRKPKERGKRVTNKLRVLIFQDHGWWVAQCLEYDIGAQAETRAEMFKRLTSTLAIEADYTTKKAGKPFAGIDPAPKEFFDRWTGASEPALLADPGHLLPLPVSYAEAA